MIIREVTIENILSHERSHIEFTRGVNVIVGPNGSGKSAIIDSITLALLAPCSGYGEEVVRASLDNIVRIGSTGGRVKVKIEVGGFAYTIERLIERRGSGEPKIALYDSNNRPIARGTREFCAKIESLLGLRDPHKVLPSTLISRQGFLSELLDMKRSERKERMLELAGLQKLEKARESLVEAMKTLEGKIRELEVKEKEFKNKEKKLREREAEIKQLESKIGDLERTLNESLDKRSKLKEELEKLERALGVWRELESLEKLKQLIEKTEKDLDTLKAKYSEIPEVDLTVLEEVWGMWKLASRLEKSIEEDQVEVEKLKSEVESLTKNAVEVLGNMGVKSADVKEGLLALKSEIKRLEETLMVIEAQIMSLENLVNVKPLEDRCPFCGAPLTRDRLYHITMEHRRKLEELKAEKLKVENDKRRLENAEKKVSELDRKIDMVNKDVERLLASIERNKMELEKFLDKCSKIAPLFNIAKVIKVSDCPASDIHNLVNKKRELEVEINKTERSLKELRERFNEELYRNLREEWMALSGGLDFKVLKTEYDNAKMRLESLDKTIDNIKTTLSESRGRLDAVKREASEVKRDIESLRVELEKLPVMRRVYEVSRWLSGVLLGKGGLLAVRLTEALRGSLESRVNDVLKKLERDFRISINEDYDVIVVREGQTLSVGSLSGGEKTVLALAFRLALASLLMEKPVSTLILDEPTEYLDENSRSMVFETISEIAGYVDQVIVVTHDVEVESIGVRHIRVSKEGGISVVKVD